MENNFWFVQMNVFDTDEPYQVLYHSKTGETKTRILEEDEIREIVELNSLPTERIKRVNEDCGCS